MRSTIERALRPLAALDAPRPGPAPTSDYDLDRAPRESSRLRAAAVLVPLVEHPAGTSVLLTRRTEHLHDHAGQVSFPGGRIEPEDDGPVAAALRETREEIGLDPSYVRVVGLLDDYETVTSYLVTPVVGFVRPGFTLDLDDFEVAEAFEIPLAFVLDPANHQMHERLGGGRRRHYHVFEYDDHYVWGATAGMLMNLYRRVRAASGQE